MVQQGNDKSRYRVYINRKPGKAFDSELEAELYFFHVLWGNCERVVLRNETKSKIVWCFEKVAKFDDEFDIYKPKPKTFIYSNDYWID